MNTRFYNGPTLQLVANKGYQVVVAMVNGIGQDAYKNMEKNRRRTVPV